MAAYLVFPTKKEWKVIERFLSQCMQGAVVISPAVREHLEKKFNRPINTAEGQITDYDFGGGDPDVTLDIAESPDAFAIGAEAVLEVLFPCVENNE
ncbi:MAG TPA: hypothetical protein V6D07_18555 [Trichocoleus sp.]